MTPTKINIERAKDMSLKIVDAYHKKQGVFSLPHIDDLMCPENQLISILPDDRIKKATWLFFACLADKATDSTLMYKKFAKFRKENTGFFDYEGLLMMQSHPELIKEKLIPTIHAAFSNRFPRFVSKNLDILLSEYDGNPLKALKGKTFSERVGNLEQFSGYGVGISSLYLIFLERYGVKKTADLVPKVDRHLIRLSIRCGVIDVPESSRVDVTVKKLEHIYKDISQIYKINATILDPTSWVIGKFLCSLNNKGICEQYCPIVEYCSNDVSIIINAKETRIYKRKQDISKNQINIFD